MSDSETRSQPSASLSYRKLKVPALSKSLRPVRRLVSWKSLRILVSIGLLALLFTEVDAAAILTILSGTNLEWLLVMVLMALLDRVSAAYRWYILLPRNSPNITMRRITRLIFTSSFVGYFLPGTVGTEILRIYGLGRGTSDLARAASSVLVERVLALAALMVLVLIGLVLTPPGFPAGIGSAALIGLAGLVAGGSMLMTPRLRLLTLQSIPGRRFAMLRSKLIKLYGCLDTYRRQPGLLSWAAATAVLFHLLRIAFVAAGGLALGLDLNLLYYVVITPIIIFVTMLPISIAGLGVQEAAYVVLFGFVGVPAETALSLSLLCRAVLLIAMLPGAWFYWRHGFHL